MIIYHSCSVASVMSHLAMSLPSRVVFTSAYASLLPCFRRSKLSSGLMMPKL